MYTALHYVRAGKKLYSPGEIIQEPLTAEQIERLTRKGAIMDDENTVYGTEPQEAAEAPERAQEAAEAPEEEEEAEYQAEDEDAEQSLLMGDLVKTEKKTERRKRR